MNVDEYINGKDDSQEITNYSGNIVFKIDESSDPFEDFIEFFKQFKKVSHKSAVNEVKEFILGELQERSRHGSKQHSLFGEQQQISSENGSIQYIYESGDDTVEDVISFYKEFKKSVGKDVVDNIRKYMTMLTPKEVEESNSEFDSERSLDTFLEDISGSKKRKIVNESGNIVYNYTDESDYYRDFSSFFRQFKNNVDRDTFKKAKSYVLGYKNIQSESTEPLLGDLKITNHNESIVYTHDDGDSALQDFVSFYKSFKRDIPRDIVEEVKQLAESTSPDKEADSELKISNRSRNIFYVYEGGDDAYEDFISFFKHITESIDDDTAQELKDYILSRKEFRAKKFKSKQYLGEQRLYNSSRNIVYDYHKGDDVFEDVKDFYKHFKKNFDRETLKEVKSYISKMT